MARISDLGTSIELLPLHSREFSRSDTISSVVSFGSIAPITILKGAGAATAEGQICETTENASFAREMSATSVRGSIGDTVTANIMLSSVKTAAIAATKAADLKRLLILSFCQLAPSTASLTKSLASRSPSLASSSGNFLIGADIVHQNAAAVPIHRATAARPVATTQGGSVWNLATAPKEMRTAATALATPKPA
jgi:hypothetical protein